VTVTQYYAPGQYDPANLPWRVRPEIAGAGIFLDLASHTLDILDPLLGPVAEAKGVAANQAGLYPAEDCVAASLAFASGTLGTGIWCFSAYSRAAVDSNEIVGSRGKLRFSTFGTEPIELATPEGVSLHPAVTPLHIQQPLIQTIVNALNGGSPCPSTGDTAVRTSVVMDAILRDWRAKEGVTLVELGCGPGTCPLCGTPCRMADRRDTAAGTGPSCPPIAAAPGAGYSTTGCAGELAIPRVTEACDRQEGLAPGGRNLAAGPSGPQPEPKPRVTRFPSMETLIIGLVAHPFPRGETKRDARTMSIHEAAETGDTQAVKRLLDGGFLRGKADANARNADGWTPRHIAAGAGQTQVVALLLDRGFDVNARNKFGETPVQLAAAMGRKETADLLRSWGGLE
jgi:hypothetical protein